MLAIKICRPILETMGDTETASALAAESQPTYGDRLFKIQETIAAGEEPDLVEVRAVYDGLNGFASSRLMVYGDLGNEQGQDDGLRGMLRALEGILELHDPS